MTILKVLQELGIRCWQHGEHEHVTAGWVGIDCPQCSPGAGYARLGINLTGGWANCWSCGGQNLAWALVQASGRPRQAVEEALGAVFTAGRPPGRLAGVDSILRLPRGLGDLSPAHCRYLKGRGFRPQALAQLWGLQSLSLHPTLSWRLFIPIYHRGELVSWTTRSIVDHGRRYRGAGKDEEKLPARSLLYGGDFLRHAVIVVEGPADAWRIGPGAAATLGTAYTQSQAEQIGRYPVRVVAYDSEPTAQKRARRLCRQLQCLPGRTYRVVIETADDPGGADPTEIAEIRRKFLEPKGASTCHAK